jgi:hypothetical protein
VSEEEPMLNLSSWINKRGNDQSVKIKGKKFLSAPKGAS